MKKLLLNTILIVSFFTLTNFSLIDQTYRGTDLRGRIVTSYYNQITPLVSAKVDLYFYDSRYPVGQQWRLITTTYTDAYGFYFFRSILPNYYTIWVNENKSYNIQVVMINYNLYSFQDLPQLNF
jgi:hypothetical protein